MKWSLEKTITSGFGAALITLAVISALSYRHVLHLIETEAKIRHNQEVVLQLGNLTSLLKEAVVAQRGYLLTNNKSYLVSYYKATRQIDTEIQTTRKLLVDDREQQARLDAIEPLIEEALKKLQKTFDLQKGGSSKLLLEAAIADGERQVANDLLIQIEALEVERNRQKQELLQDETVDRETTAAIAASGALLAFILIPLGIIIVRINIARLRKTEELFQQQVERERIIRKITQSIHQTLNVEEVGKIIVEEVRQLFHVERVLMYRFQADWGERSVVESLVPGCKSAKGLVISEPWTEGEEWIEKYQQGQVQAIDDVANSNLDPISLRLMENFNVKSKLVVPILASVQPGTSQTDRFLWGFITLHACEWQRRWLPSEIALLEQLVQQLGIAIQQSELHQQVEKLAYLDGLTEIANRRSFDRCLLQEWQRMAREKLPLSLILCDIDYFKAYNDTYGHQGGDRCLREVSQAISRTVKRPGDLVARYGGEEIAVILPNTNLQGAMQVAVKIRWAIQALELPHRNSGVSQLVTLSSGVASTIPEPKSQPIGLIDAADKALYRAKEQGRDRIVVASNDDETNNIGSECEC